MSTNFPLSDIADIDEAIQEGRGAAAETLGQAYDVRRLTGSTTGSITAGNPVYTNFPARLRRINKRIAIENATFDLVVMQATCDGTKLQLQDLLTEVGYGSDGASYCVAQKRLTRETLLVRTEASINITRPMPAGGRAEDQPAQGIIESPGYGGIDKSGEQVLTLKDGLYEFVDCAQDASPAVVPVGIQPLGRVKDGGAIGLPTALYREDFLVYVPILPGEPLNELDRVNFGSSDRYQIARLFSTDMTGLAGWILMVEKTAV